MKKTIKAWAVINTKGNWPCVITNRKGETIGSVIFSDEDGNAKTLAKRHFDTYGEGIKHVLGIKLLPVVISYTIPKRKK